MFTVKHFPHIIGAATVALLLAAAPSYAQTTSAGTTDTTARTSDAAAARSGTISKNDQEMMEDLAEANLAEIETGKMALDKSQSDSVKKFAQQMIDDHTTALTELQKLAQSKQVTLPEEPDLQHKGIATALKVLSGATFDKQYIARVGVGDHQRTQKLLQKIQRTAKDPDLKAHAQKTLKVVSQHLAMGKKLKPGNQ